MRRVVTFSVLLLGCSSGTSSAPAPSASVGVSTANASGNAHEAAPKASGVPLPVHLFLGSTASHACFLSKRNNLFCWGRNDVGQLGSDRSSVPGPAQWNLGAPVRSAALGEKHTCALLEDGRVRCVGVDASGERHPGDSIPELADVQSLVAGGDFTCALSRDGSVRCWGRMPGKPGPQRDPKLVEGLTATELTASTGTLCAVTHGGTVCLGDNAGGATLIGGSPTLEAPTLIPYAAAVRHAGVSDLGLCGLDGDRAQCWTDDANRTALEIYSADDVEVGADGLVCMLRVNGLFCERLPHRTWLGWQTDGSFREIGVGRGFVCALPKTMNEVASCWGENSWGQLGVPVPKARIEATKIGPLQGATRIAAGTESLCGLMPDKKIRCLGSNGKTAQHWAPGGTTDTALGDDAANTITRADDMSIGGGIRCAFTDGLPTCWGDNRYNQLSSVNPGIIDQPSTFASLGKLERLVFGPSDACSLASDEKVRCWGGAGKERKMPTEVVGINDVLDIAVGGDQACALLKDGTVSCFLLHGDHALEPRKIEGAKGLTTLAAGARHFCGVTARHEVSCFGANDSGQLGRPLDANNGARAMVVAKLDRVKEITLGETFTCALRDGGTVQCFGSATDGELAREEKGPTTEPVPIGGLKDVVQIAASSHAMSARLADGSVVAWGGGAFFAKVGTDVERSDTPREIVTKHLTEESP